MQSCQLCSWSYYNQCGISTNCATTHITITHFFSPQCIFLVHHHHHHQPSLSSIFMLYARDNLCQFTNDLNHSSCPYLTLITLYFSFAIYFYIRLQNTFGESENTLTQVFFQYFPPARRKQTRIPYSTPGGFDYQRKVNLFSPCIRNCLVIKLFHPNQT